MNLSTSEISLLDGIGTVPSFSDLAQQLRRKDTDVTDIYFISVDAARKPPTLVSNQNARVKQRVRGICKRCTLKVRLLMDLCASCQKVATCRYQG